MRWFKHVSGIGRSPAMAELRSVLGLAGYDALWLLLERIAESWDGSDEPDLCLPEREWRICCDFSAKKFQIFTEILQKHDIIRMEQCGSLLRLKASILLQLQDEWTRKTRKNSGVPPEPPRSNSGIQTDKYPEREKDNKTRPALFPVLKRHGIRLDSERAGNILRYVEQKQQRIRAVTLNTSSSKNMTSIRCRMETTKNTGRNKQTGNRGRNPPETFCSA